MARLFLTNFLFLIPLILYAQENWNLAKEKNGISVYTRMLNSERYKQVRVICEFNGPIEKLIKILQDVDNHKNWVYKTPVSYLISKKNADTLYFYSEISLPWPASHRDASVELAVAKDSLNKNAIITVRSFPKLVPYKANIIRVPYSLGLYKLNSLPNNKIKIDYTLSVNPGGTLPAWLVNYTATIGPYQTFVNLKEIVENH